MDGENCGQTLCDIYFVILGQLTRRPHLNCMDQGSLEFNMLSTIFSSILVLIAKSQLVFLLVFSFKTQANQLKIFGVK
jgi:hypothetical protein